MPKNPESTRRSKPRLWDWTSRIGALPRMVGAVLLLAGLPGAAPAAGVAPPGPYSVNLAWQGSPSPDVAGYRIYYGTNSGNYPNSVTIGNVTTNTFFGLVSGVAYYFAVTAYTAGGAESGPSNEIGYVPGQNTLQLRGLPNRQTQLTVRGLINHTYEILAGTNLQQWNVIGNVTLGSSAVTNFTDANAANFSQRFYRTRDLTP